MLESVIISSSEDKEDDDIEVEEVVIDTASNALKPLSSSWDDDKIEKLDYDVRNKRKWRCLWCCTEFAQWNTCKPCLMCLKMETT